MEAAASNIDALIRKIPVFEGWIEDGKNMYMASSIDEFEDKIKKILNKELPSLKEEQYRMAESREIKKVGKELIDVYKKVLEK